MKHKHTRTRSRAQRVFPAGASLPFTGALTTKTRWASADLTPKTPQRQQEKTIIIHLAIKTGPAVKKATANQRAFFKEFPLFQPLKCATKRYKMHNAPGHGSTFDLLFKQRGRSLLFSELPSTPRPENKWGFVLRLAPSLPSCQPPQH